MDHGDSCNVEDKREFVEHVEKYLLRRMCGFQRERVTSVRRTCKEDFSTTVENFIEELYNGVL